MKNLWLIFIAFAIFSCKTEKKVDYAIISGTIENANSEKLTLYNSYNTNIKKDLILVDGKFTDTVKIDAGNLFFLRQDRNYLNLFLAEGNTLEFSFDAAKLDSTIVFTGDNSATNTYFIEKKNSTKDIALGTKDLYSKNEEEFSKNILAVKKAQEDFLYNTEGLSEEFSKNEGLNINYQYLSAISNFETYHGYFTKDKDFKASETLTAPLSKITFDNENDYVFSSNYRGLVGKHYRNKSEELVKNDSLLKSDLTFLQTLSEIKSDKIRNNLLYNDVKYGITYTDNLEEYYAMFIKGSTNQENITEITESYNKLKALAEGNISPSFSDYENNAGGTTSLKDLKGKYVYIDVWATWCGPCIAEIPSLKKVEKEFHDKNIEFLSISIDDKKDHEKWKKMIVDKELGGMQLFADNNWESQFIEDYMIKGIPRFILLDPEGKIVNANAPRPSDEKLVKKFEDLKI